MNAMRTGNSADRQIAFHPIGLPHLKTLVASLITWLIPQAQLNQVRAVLFLLAFFVFLGSGFYVWRRRIYNFNDLRPIYLPLFFILVYLFSLGISISFFDAQSTFKGRFLSPVWLAAVIILLYLIDRLLFLVKCPRAFKVFIVCVLLFVTGANLQFGISWIWQAHELGLGYSSPNWAQSGLIARIRALPMDIPIYSNGSDVIYFFTGRHTYDLPLKISYTSLQTNQAYTTELHNMKAKLTGEKGVLVIFDAFRGRTYLPAEDELKAEIPMQLLFKAEDGVMYGGLNGPSN